jgi:anti-sigma factor (TIGR02949 family)
MSDSSIITCEEALSLLAEYLDGELAQGDRSTLERHLAICRGCFSRTEFERLLRERLASLGSEPPTPAFAQRVRTMVERFTL